MQELAGRGWIIVSGAEAGLPPHEAVRTALESALRPDRQAGKLHAQWTAPWLQVAGIMRYGVQLDYFRNFAGVVLGLHKDDHDGTGMVWCLGRECEGGEFYLSDDPDGLCVVMSHALQPGELLVFDDTRFWHGVTEITYGWRDVLVINAAKADAAALALDYWR